MPEVRRRFGDGEWHAMLDLHALPDGWESMEYASFLEQRRRRMAAIIRRGFETLA